MALKTAPKAGCASALRTFCVRDEYATDETMRMPEQFAHAERAYITLKCMAQGLR